MEARARLGGDVDVDLNGEVIGDDFYSVLGLVRDLQETNASSCMFSSEFPSLECEFSLSQSV